MFNPSNPGLSQTSACSHLALIAKPKRLLLVTKRTVPRNLEGHSSTLSGRAADVTGPARLTRSRSAARL